MELRMIMRLDILIFLLQHLLCNPTNKTHSLLIILNRLSILTQLCKCINEHTPHNISKQQIHEDNIHHIEEETARLERFHLRVDLLIDVKGQNTVEHSLAVLLGKFALIQGTHIKIDRKNGEDSNERSPQQRQHPQYLYFGGNGSNHTLENIHMLHHDTDYQYRKPLNPVQSAQHTTYQKQQQTRKLIVVVDQTVYIF